MLLTSMFTLPPSADIGQCGNDVGYGPKADNAPYYSYGLRGESTTTLVPTDARSYRSMTS